MQDILKKYRKHRIFANVSLVLTSLVLAIGINITLVDGTEVGKNIKTSILNSDFQKSNSSDIYMKNNSGSISILTSNNINNIENISYSITYNPENITIEDLLTKKGELIELNNSNGIKSIIINYNSGTTLKSGDEIGIIKINEKKQGVNNINIINANFNDTSSEIKYSLSTSGITF